MINQSNQMRRMVDKAARLKESDNPRSAFIRLGMDAVLALAEKMDEQVLLRAVTSESPLAAIATVFGDAQAPAILGPARASSRQTSAETLARLRLKAARGREQLLAMAGGTFSTAQVAQHLGISPQAVAKRREKARLLAVHLGNRYGYPVFQFDANGVLPGLERALKALAGYSTWAQLSFLLNANDWLDGRSPRDRLAAGEVEAVLGAAAEFGVHGAA